jgi:hypothetical protein
VSTLDVITWNVCVENSADHIQTGLRELAQSRPHVIALQECYHYRPHLPGYRVFQLPRRPDEHGLVNEDADVAVLIRDDVKVKRHRVIRMKQPWVGPKAGKKHAPRVFHTFALKVDGKTWKVAAAHWAFPADNAAAVAEHKRWTARWLRGVRPGALVGDLNQHASPIHGRRSTGQGVDRAVLARCTGVSRSVAHAYGSDHHPALITLTA